MVLGGVHTGGSVDITLITSGEVEGTGVVVEDTVVLVEDTLVVVEGSGVVVEGAKVLVITTLGGSAEAGSGGLLGLGLNIDATGTTGKIGC